MSEKLQDYSKLPEESTRKLFSFGVGTVILLVGFLLLTIIYTVGEKFRGFRWDTFRNGLFSFGLILLVAVLIIAGMTVLGRGLALLWPEMLTTFASKRKLRTAKKKAESAIEEKHRLSEERARLTAQLKATFLFEKETIRCANAQASQEFRDALQSTVMRSCQIALDHISQLVDQYEKVVLEIEQSDLPDDEKSDLLDALTAQLDVAATEEKNRSAQKMMESEIWKVRFRKAKALAGEKTASAIQYLRRIRPEARSAKMKSRIDSMIASLDSGQQHS
ncbi:MAG TPA: hypothetical protein DCG12_06510 [Planctomycetaceae bacterium]|nr:hypothetical protein [Planctomycetaceae bacterium]|tara:strand:- start:70 stop:900 length:831 start_codon:yes stop_codon:yes gene_type:complete